MLRRSITLLVATGLALGAAAGACEPADGELVPDAPTSPPSEGGGGSLGPAPLTLTGVTLDQAVQRDLEVSIVPLVGGRPALLRMFYEQAEVDQAVTATVEIDGEEVATGEAMLQKESDVSELDSTINVLLPGEALTAGTHEVVLRLRQGDETVLRYPDNGAASVAVDAMGIALEVVFVPFVAPPTNAPAPIEPTTQQVWRDRLYARLPVTDVTTSVDAPLVLPETLAPFSTGWSEAMNALYDRRLQDGAAPNQIYFGLFDPGIDFDTYCEAGCVNGLSPGTEGYQPELHTIVTLAYPERAGIIALSNVAFIHDIGVTGCATTPGQEEPNYPHPLGTIGGWGYDLIAENLVPPESVDFASQCAGELWVSDYTWLRLFAYQQQIAADL